MKMLRSCLVAGLVLMSAGVAHAAGRSGYTLIVAPARYAVMQVAADIVDRHPALLVSYQTDASASEPLLHAWNAARKEWVHITMQEFREVSFLEKMPGRTVLLGDDTVLPSELKDAAGWSPELIRINSLNAAALINEFGRIMKWPVSEWKWFARRYNLTLNDESEALRKSSWYDHKGPMPRPKSGLLKDEKPAAKEAAPAPAPAPAKGGAEAEEEMPPPAPVTTVAPTP